VPEPDIRVDLRDMERTRSSLVAHDRTMEDVRLTRAGLIARRDALLEAGALDRAVELDTRIERADEDLARGRVRRDTLIGEITGLSDGLVSRFHPESLVATLDGRRPVAMLPVRIETRFASQTKLMVRVFPDQLHLDVHDPALTVDEAEGARWYWSERWRAGLDDLEKARATWTALTSRFRPVRAAYLVKTMTPINAPGAGDPEFPDVPTRESRWSRAPLATALPDRFCVVGLAHVNGTWTERFRQWGNAVPDQLAVGPDPRNLAKAEVEGDLPVDEGTRWLREPGTARDQGALIEVDHPSLAQGVDRLIVLGVDWTQAPEKAAASLGTLLGAQRFSGHLGFVAQGTPTNNTSETRAGFTTAEAEEAVALDPSATPAPADEWSAGTRLAAALGLPADTFGGLPGADGREHAWASALVDALWRATAGYYISDILDPLAKGKPQVEADLREFVRRNVFACGPLPTLRVAAQPYGVLPVVSSRRFEPGPAPEELVHRVVTLMRDVVSGAIAAVPHLRRAGEDQDVDALMLALLQRTPVPWTFRFRPLTGPIERKNMSVRWDIANMWQRTWTTAMWAGLGVYQTARISELTHGKDNPLPVPLVTKPGEQNPTAYLDEIADLTSDPQGRAALNLREDSIALLEALAACSAVLELDHCALQVTHDRLALTAEALAKLPALSRLSIPTPDSVRVEDAPVVPLAALDFRSGRQLADAVIPDVSPHPLGEFVTGEFGARLGDLVALLGAPTDPFYWLANHRVALRTLAAAPVDQLEWAFRGYLDLFSTRLDAWFTGLATARLADHRSGAGDGVHIGCWGIVEDLRHDLGAGAESFGFVHAPSLAHAASSALLRNGRLANRGDDGAVFDLEVTSARVRRAMWLLEGVAQGQRLAALLGYRLERRLRESGLTMMRYQMAMRRTAPLLGPDIPPDESVEVLAARDVVDGVALLDRWRDDPDRVLDAIAQQAGLAALPGADATRLRQVISDVYDSYDAVSDLLVAESVHQAAVGNLDRSGAALSAHDRHGRAPDLDYVSAPQSGHTVAHRVAIAVQSPTLRAGWRRDARGAAEPMLDAWVARLLGAPGDWQFAAVARGADGTRTPLAPVSLADLGLGPLSVALAAQRTGQGSPSELVQRIGLAFAAQMAANSSAELELLADAPSSKATGGLALLETVGDWVAKVSASSPLTAGDLLSSADVGGATASPGTLDLAELAARVDTTRATLTAVITALGRASTANQRTRALLDAVAFDGPDAMPRVPPTHSNATVLLGSQVDEVRARLVTLDAAVAAAVSEQPSDGDNQVAARHSTVLRALLGQAQPVLPLWTLADAAPVSVSLDGRADLVGDDHTAPAAWLQRSALVRPELEAFAGLMMHAEAAGTDVAAQLGLVQLPHRPGAPWLARPLGESGVPPHGSVGIVVHSWDPLNASRAFAGLVVDAWTETLPSDTETTAVTFHYDAPGARAPQAVLLAVHPARTPERWSFDILLDTVNEAADLAQLRTLSSAELAPMGSFLPALYLPDDYTHDVPSVSLAGLISRAQAAGILTRYTDVLGKA
jgi:hypothetical protein